MKHSHFPLNINKNKNYECFSCQRQSFSERVQRSETPQRSEDNCKGASLLGKEIVR